MKTNQHRVSAVCISLLLGFVMPFCLGIALPLIAPSIWVAISAWYAKYEDRKYVTKASCVCLANAIGIACSFVLFGDLHGVREDQIVPLYGIVIIGIPLTAVIIAQASRLARGYLHQGAKRGRELNRDAAS
jgi:ABC-type uncharacterized transport system permease subunit